MSLHITGSRARWRCAADVTKPLVAIETGYSAGDDGVKPEVRVERLRDAVQRQPALPPHAALGAAHPRHAPVGTVRGGLENAAGQARAVAVIPEMPLEVLDEVGERRSAKLRIRRHCRTSRAWVRGTAAR